MYKKAAPMRPDNRRIAMFKTNEGTIDRALRIIVGLGLLVWFFVDQGTGFWHYAKLIGIVPLLTGLVGTCPVYSMLGLSTCPMKRT
jgi:Protein of unknown function (DUF2892)